MSAATQPKDDRLPMSSRYRISKCIARGGTGSVYAGVQRGAAGFERPVAIKRTHAHLLREPGMRQYILDEARNACAVRHPNVVSIDDVEEVDGELLLVMDFIDGGSLSQLVGTSSVPTGVALRILLEACAGLAAIHDAADPSGASLGLVHRDVSPQNLLVGTDGVTRVTDFGIAKRANDPKRTAKASRRGKLGYMAPEYIRTGTATQSVDIFAMGIVMWETLVGACLFRRQCAADTLTRTLEGAVPDVSSLVPEVPTAIGAVVARSLAKSPADRYASAHELHEALAAAAAPLAASRNEVARFVARVTGKVPAMAPKAPAMAPPKARPLPAKPPLVPTRRYAVAMPSLPPGHDEDTDTVMDVRVDELIELSATTGNDEIEELGTADFEELRIPAAPKLAHPAFCLEEKLASLPFEASMALLPTRPVQVPHRSRRGLFAAAVVCVLVTGFTTALVYAGLSEDPPGASSQR